MSDLLLSKMFRVRSRFSRSVNLVRDSQDPHALDGYIVTPLARAILGRLVDSVSASHHPRAWSITGPYGTGKSACCLFVSSCLAVPDHPQAKRARRALHSVDRPLHRRAFAGRAALARAGLVPILVGGSREPIAQALLRALETTIAEALRKGKQTEVLRANLKRLRRRTQQGKPVADGEVVALISDLARAVASSRKPLGLLVVIDELGKLLEHASLYPRKGDVFLLQALAEAANRSDSTPILLVTVLHQAFGRYAAHLGVEQQQEWAKVQGRFEDIGFIEHSDQLLRLVGAAIRPSRKSLAYQKIARRGAADAAELCITPKGMSRSAARRALEDCAPLHPVTALVLGPLFRGRLAQNERSLFAFLSSEEACGFQSFLKNPSNAWGNSGRKPFYRLDALYDYIASALGNTVVAQDQGKRWAEIGDALERLPEDRLLDERVVKSVGMLNILGDNRFLKASASILENALVDGRDVRKKDVAKSLARLKKAGLVVYRHHSDSYAIWEGSDVDIDERFQKGRDRIGRSEGLADLLRAHAKLAPYVAKRHLHETGTLRYFRPLVVDQGEVDDRVGEPLGDADGQIVLVLPATTHTARQTALAMVKKSKKLPKPLRMQTLFGIPGNLPGLRQALEELMTWKWVAENTPGLEGDRIARKELSARLSEAQQHFERLCATCLGKGAAHSSCLWVHGGKQYSFRSAREFAAKLSDICDLVFHAAPRIHNELVNRRRLSSAAAGARTALMGRMLAAPDMQGLGIKGTPPEMSMYVSVLEQTRLHHREGERWLFGCPNKPDRSRVRPVWRAIERFLSSTETGKRSIAELFAELSRPPLGIKSGLLPILLLAYVVQAKDEVAVYENGSFVPEHDTALFQRLVKSPEQFSIQRYQVAGARRDVLRKVAAALAGEGSSNKATLLGALRPLFALFSDLPPYCRETQNLGRQAIAVRNVLKSAQDPHRIMFEDLPRAVGMETLRRNTSGKNVEGLLIGLKAALAELERSYEELLGMVESQLRDALLLPKDPAKARDRIAARAALVAGTVADLRLRGFAMRLADRGLEHRQWLESVAACVVGRPPRQWRDPDLSRFGVTLADVASQFVRIEELALAKASGHIPADHRVLRLGVMDGAGKELREVVHFGPEEEAQVIQLAQEMEALLQSSWRGTNISAAAIAELAKRVLMAGREGGPT